MKAAIVGTQGVGKTTLFRILTGIADSHRKGLFSGVGVATVHDERLERLFVHLGAERKTPIHVEIYDFDGFGKMWKEKEAGKVLQSLLGFDALIQVIADFEPHNALDTFDEVNLRLLLSDLDFVSRHLERLRKELSARRVSPKLVELFEKILKPLEKEVPLSAVGLKEEEKKELSGFGLLTLLPRVLVLNREESKLGRAIDEELLKKIEENEFQFVQSSLPLEEEILSLSEDEEKSFREELSVKPIKEELFKELFKACDFIVFYTVVHSEVRAWPLKRGQTALKAAGKIHTDMERGFIRAEVINIEDLFKASSFKEAQKLGLTRIEGKEYIVQDGDVLTVRFSPQ